MYVIIFKIPKDGLFRAAWKKRLAQYARDAMGLFKFGRAPAPPHGSEWAIERGKIDPVQKGHIFGKN